MSMKSEAEQEGERLEAECRLLHPEICAWLDAGNSFADYKPGIIRKNRVEHSELMAFYETIPESMRVHLTESQVEEEYIHHYGKP